MQNKLQQHAQQLHNAALRARIARLQALATAANKVINAAKQKQTA